MCAQIRSYRSFAKINLHLQVDAKRPDGYHELQTVFQTVSLHDLIHIEMLERPGLELTVPGGGAPEGEVNLAHRAARAMLDRWAPSRGVRIRLSKQIPAGGGLGGGSSNAATVLLALSDLLALDGHGEDLVEIARGLGADVPYFLVGGTALGQGRGDRIIPLGDLPEQEVVLVDPGVSVSTAEVFAVLPPPERRPLPTRIAELIAGDGESSISELAGINDLEGLVLERVPRVRAVYNALRRAGADFVRLSGSGATVFACFADSRRAVEAESHLPRDTRVFVVRTLGRSAVNEARSVMDDEGEGG